jgi:hypothetical protein
MFSRFPGTTWSRYPSRNALDESGQSKTACLRRVAHTSPAFFSRSHDAMIRVCDEAGNVIETHENKGEFKEP